MNEITLEKLRKHLPAKEASFEPCFAFSVHKCGSTLMHAMISKVCHMARVPAVTLPDIMFNMGEIGIDWMSDPSLLPVFKKRMIFFGFRNLPAVLTEPESQIRDRKFVLLVRDPRDALVSQYFSFGRKKSSHAVPRENPKEFLDRLNSVPETEIDTYVRQASKGLLRKLEAYRDHLNFDHGMVRRYEDIYFDKETFLSEIFDHFGVEISPAIITEVAQQHDIRPAQEDDSKHIRKGTPGDHREKLTSATIEALNDTFRDIGSFYGYDL